MCITSIRLAISVVFVGILCGCALEPPFEWDPSYSTPGTSLTLQEVDRTSGAGGSIVFYELRSSGFTPGESVTLWRLSGYRFQTNSLTIKPSGVVQYPGIAADSIAYIRMMKGEALDYAIVSQDGEKRAQAKVIPFPIESRGTGRSWASGELLAPGGLEFLFTFGGFNPGEKVQVTSRYGDEVIDNVAIASPDGGFLIPMRAHGSSGQATLTAKGSSGTVTIRFNIGRDAMIIQ